MNELMQINGQSITQSDVFNAIDIVLDNLSATGDLLPVEHTLKALLGVQDISGLALARLLYGLKQWWDSNNMEEKTKDKFEDWCYSISTKVKPITIQRYVSVWDKYEKGLFTDKIQEHSLTTQIAISKTLEQGYNISDSEWKKLERAESFSEVGVILREVKGQKPKKGSLQIYLERDGSLVVWDENGKYYIGQLNLQDTSDIVCKAINRIVDNSGVIKR